MYPVANSRRIVRHTPEAYAVPSTRRNAAGDAEACRVHRTNRLAVLEGGAPARGQRTADPTGMFFLAGARGRDRGGCRDLSVRRREHLEGHHLAAAPRHILHLGPSQQAAAQIRSVELEDRADVLERERPLLIRRRDPLAGVLEQLASDLVAREVILLE